MSVGTAWWIAKYAYSLTPDHASSNLLSPMPSISRHTPQGMREWVRIDSLRAFQWYTLSEGIPAVAPPIRGEVCAELLKRLVALRPAVDAEGAPVRPVPRAKRVLCGPRTLPHIVQALLAGGGVGLGGGGKGR